MNSFSAQLSIPIIKTKITIPKIRHNSVHRHSLIEKLALGIGHALPLSLISAPPGYGKTTLAVELLHSQGYSSAWFSIENSENDPFRFFSYLHHTLRSHVTNLDKALNPIFSLGQLPLAETLMSCFINELVNLPEQLILVLEDYHRITDPYVHQAIQLLLEQNLPLFHVIIVTREDPPFPLAIWRARNRLTEIRAGELRFTPKETLQFFAETMGLTLNNEQVDLLETRTEGWVTGLQLVGLSLNSIHPEQVSAFIESFQGNNRFILDYLVETVLNNLTPELKNFICQISVLERFSSSLCDAVTGRTDSLILLRQLEQANMFLVVLDPQGQWYRFHHLFADLLRMEVPKQNQSAIYRKAAGWFENNGNIDQAVALYVAAEEWLEAARLILSEADKFIKRGKGLILLQWIESLPNATLQSQVELVVFKVWALFLSGQFANALICAHSIEQTVTPKSLHPNVRGKWLSVQTWLANYRQSPDTINITKNALQLIPKEDTLSQVAALIPLGSAQINEGNMEEAIRTLDKAYHLGNNKLGYSIPTMTAAINYAFSLHDAGRNQEAIIFCKQILSRYRDRKQRILPLAELAYIPLGVLCYEANQLQEALDYSLKAMIISRNVLSQEVMGGDAERTMALVQFAMGEREAAFETLREARQLVSENGLTRIAQIFDRIEVELRLRMGDLNFGKHWAQLMEFTPRTQPTPKILPALITYTRVLIADNQLHTAESLLCELSRLATNSQRKCKLLTIYLLQAKLMALQSNKNLVIDFLQRALTLATLEGKLRFFLDEGPFMREFLPKVNHIAPIFVNHLIEEFRKSDSLQNSVISSSVLVEPLSERELEILRLVAAGLSNQEIANQLFITVGTTKWHLNNIYGKLGTSSRTQAIVHARHLNIVP